MIKYNLEPIFPSRALIESKGYHWTQLLLASYVIIDGSKSQQIKGRGAFHLFVLCVPFCFQAYTLPKLFATVGFRVSLHSELSRSDEEDEN